MNSNVKVTWTFFENTLAPNFWQGISKGCSLILDYFELEEIKVSQFINCMLFLLKIENEKKNREWEILLIKVWHVLCEVQFFSYCFYNCSIWRIYFHGWAFDFLDPEGPKDSV